ncbi:MAG: para-aminobenzoate synthetase component 1, partial [Granulosicoccus sp.]
MIEIFFNKNKTTFTVDEMLLFKKKAFAWATQFEVVSYLDSNQHISKYAKYEALLAVGAEDEILPNESEQSSFEILKSFYETKKDWLFGFLTYDLKNEIEALHSNNLDNIELPNLHFFQPKIVIEFSEKEIRIHSKDEKAISVFEKINQTSILDKTIFSHKK